MAKSFIRSEVLDAFDRIATAAVQAGVRMELAVYGGSALLLASNFRFASEDVDIAEIGRPWPDWFERAVVAIANDNGWNEDWLNDAVAFHLSALADKANDHVEFGTFPRGDGPVGLTVFVPSPDYMLALKLKASRFLDPGKGADEAADVLNLMKITGADTPEKAIDIMRRYFPRSGADAEKQVFLLRHIIGTRSPADAPEYPLRNR